MDPFTTALGIGGSIVSGILGNRGARQAAREQQRATAEAQGYYGAARQGYTPYTSAGEQNLNRLNQLMGGDYSGFTSGPDYQASLQEGMKALDRGAAARGALYSGGADADRIQFGSNLAAQTLGNYRNALSGLAGMGLQAQGAVSDIYGQQAQTALGLGDAMAQNRMGRAGNWQNTVSNLVGFGSDYLGGRGVWGGGKPSMKPGK